MRCLAEVINAAYSTLDEYEFQNAEAIPFERMVMAVNVALIELAAGLLNDDVAVSRTAQNLVAGTALYSYPSGILNRQAQCIKYVASSGKETLIAPTTMAKMDLENDAWLNDENSTPQRWMHDPYQGKIRLWPPPDTGATNGLVVYHASTPTAVQRYWGTPVTDTLRLSVVYNSAACWLSVAPTGDQCAVGDYIGVIPATTTTGIIKRSALRFYRIIAIAGTPAKDLTLNSAYQGATNPAAYFVSGQAVSLLEAYESLSFALVFTTCRVVAELSGRGDDPNIAKSGALAAGYIAGFRSIAPNVSSQGHTASTQWR